MADEDIELPDRGYTTEDVRAVHDEPPKRKRRRWGLKLLAILVVVPSMLLGLLAFIALTYTYSSGERAGYVQKLSRKGWLCKTWEGILGNLADQVRQPSGGEVGSGSDPPITRSGVCRT